MCSGRAHCSRRRCEDGCGALAVQRLPSSNRIFFAMCIFGAVRSPLRPQSSSCIAQHLMRSKKSPDTAQTKDRPLPARPSLPRPGILLRLEAAT
eukprot:6956985-Prymnesium_polylepis.2